MGMCIRTDSMILWPQPYNVAISKRQRITVDCCKASLLFLILKGKEELKSSILSQKEK